MKRLTEEQIEKVSNDLSNGCTLRETAEKNGVSMASVQKIKKGKKAKKRSITTNKTIKPQKMETPKVMKMDQSFNYNNDQLRSIIADLYIENNLLKSSVARA